MGKGHKGRVMFYDEIYNMTPTFHCPSCFCKILEEIGEVDVSKNPEYLKRRLVYRTV